MSKDKSGSQPPSQELPSVANKETTWRLPAHLSVSTNSTPSEESTPRADGSAQESPQADTLPNSIVLNGREYLLDPSIKDLPDEFPPEHRSLSYLYRNEGGYSRSQSDFSECAPEDHKGQLQNLQPGWTQKSVIQGQDSEPPTPQNGSHSNILGGDRAPLTVGVFNRHQSFLDSEEDSNRQGSPEDLNYYEKQKNPAGPQLTISIPSDETISQDSISSSAAKDFTGKKPIVKSAGRNDISRPNDKPQVTVDTPSTGSHSSLLGDDRAWLSGNSFIGSLSPGAGDLTLSLTAIKVGQPLATPDSESNILKMIKGQASEIPTPQSRSQSNMDAHERGSDTPGGSSTEDLTQAQAAPAPRILRKTTTYSSLLELIQAPNIEKPASSSSSINRTPENSRGTSTTTGERVNGNNKVGDLPRISDVETPRPSSDTILPRDSGDKPRSSGDVELAATRDLNPIAENQATTDQVKAPPEMAYTVLQMLQHTNSASNNGMSILDGPTKETMASAHMPTTPDKAKVSGSAQAAQKKEVSIKACPTCCVIL
jgi:hypothetical protein